MFGQSGSGSAEMLLGRGIFDGSIGANGYNDSSNSIVSSSVSGGSSTFDMGDFPSADSNSFASALRQQQQFLSQQQMIQGGKSQQPSSLHRLAMGSTPGSNVANFNMTTEDFPALPGSLSTGSSGLTGLPSGSGLLGGVEGAQRDLSSGSSTPATSFGTSVQQQFSINSSSGNNSMMFGSNLESLSKHFDSSSLATSNVSGHGSITGAPPSTNPGLAHQPQRPSTGQSNVVTGTVAAVSGQGQAGSSVISGDYGLLGLLKVIRMTDADRNALALGSDLTALGLNLNSSDNLYSTFASPWSENPTSREPHYQLPLCYYMQPPALKTGHLTKFQLETLFYIFYAMPRDSLQAFAAQELYSREWRYHVELKLWFKRAGVTDGIAIASSGGQYIYFDINSWERRLFSGSMSQNIASGLLSEEDVRVEFTSS